MNLLHPKLLILVLWAAVFSLPLTAAAAEDADAKKTSEQICNEVLGQPKGKIVARHDGLSIPNAEEGLNDALEARDTLHKLGVPTPPHQIIFAPERQLNILTATGVLPMPHAISGSEIYRALASGQGLGVLEFAWPGGAPSSFHGCATCRSYYSNMTKMRDNRPIYLHVGGHNHIFMKSLIMRKRNVDPIAASEDLAKELETQYDREGFEPVSMFFHYLYATNQLQDYVNATFDTPDELSPAASQLRDVEVKKADGNWNFLNDDKKVQKAPWERSPSILQYTVTNLPTHIPAYKRELIRKFELTNRVYPAVSQQKFVHEGWATFLMMLGQKHSKWTTDRDVFDFARLIQGVVGPNIQIDQPYSFGVRAYYHLYLKFMREPHLQDKTDLARDILFVQYVDKLVETMTDADFVARVVDEEFVTRHRLALVREGSSEELGKVWHELAQKGVPQDKWPRGVIISTNADRIRRHILRRVGMKNSPQMVVVNPALANPFQVNLEQTAIEDSPLEPISAAQVFFAQTQVSELPVSATFLLSERWLDPNVEAPKVFPVRIEVRPDGRVRIHRRNSLDLLAKDPQESELPELSELLQDAVDFYKTDQTFSFSDKTLEEDRRRWEQMFPKLIDEEIAKANLKPLEGLVDYAPTAARAIMLFSKLIKARFAKQMEAAFQGKLKLRFGPNGVKLPLIPMTPHLQYDREHLQRLSQLQPPAPMDTIDHRLTAMQIAHDADDGDLVGSVGGSVGDPVQIPPGGQGEGQGKGEGEEGDGNEIEVPVELFRRILALHFEIPNPRETDGDIPMMKTIKMGERRDSTEEPIWEKMTSDALVKGIIARRARGQSANFGEISPAELIREGFGKLDEEDYIIRSKRDVPIPSFDAVVVVNVDLTGSMQGHRIELVKNFVYNVRELFKAIYPLVKFHYVGFDSSAKEYTEAQIWNAYKGGSTEYGPAAKLTREILAKYPTGRWNHYVIFAGDSELFDLQNFMSEFDQLRKTLQYFALLVSRDPGDPDPSDDYGLRQALRGYKSKWKWIGATQINDQDEIFRGLGDLFPKGGNFKD